MTYEEEITNCQCVCRSIDTLVQKCCTQLFYKGRQLPCSHDTCLFSRQIYQFNLLKLRSWVSISRRINPFANIPSLQDVIQISYGKLRPSNEIGISNNQNHHKYLRVVLTSWNNREFLLDQPTFFYNFRRIIVQDTFFFKNIFALVCI